MKIKFIVLIILTLSSISLYSQDYSEELWKVHHIYKEAGMPQSQIPEDLNDINNYLTSAELSGAKITDERMDEIDQQIKAGPEAYKKSEEAKVDRDKTQIKIKYDNLMKSITKNGTIEEIKNYFWKKYAVKYNDEGKVDFGEGEGKENLKRFMSEIDKLSIPDNEGEWEVDLVYSDSGSGKKEDKIIIIYDPSNKDTISLDVTDTSEIGKEIYFASNAFWKAEKKKAENLMADVAPISKRNSELWDAFFENVRGGPQYPWEEVINSQLITTGEIGEIVGKPREKQIVFIHPSLMAEFNDDDLEPSLTIEVIGIRKFTEESLYQTNYGASLAISFNSDEDDDIGIGIVGNVNDIKIGVFYRDTDRDVSKWWLGFGMDLARFTTANPPSVENQKSREEAEKFLPKE